MIPRMTRPRIVEMDDQLNVRLPSAMRRELEAAAKRERLPVLERQDDGVTFTD